MTIWKVTPMRFHVGEGVRGCEAGGAVAIRGRRRWNGAMNDAAIRTAWLLGLAGLLPFAGAALVGLASPAWHDPALLALRGYGAVILAFLGAVHWGFALLPEVGQEKAGPKRLALGIVPALIAWVALLLPVGPALALLALAILVTAAIEQWAAAEALVPHSYMRLRWILSAGAAACLVTGLTA